MKFIPAIIAIMMFTSVKPCCYSDNVWKDHKETLNLSDISENQLFITEGGDYTLSGTLSGSVIVNTEEKIKLRLADVTITSDSSPCIYIENADKAYITTEDETENTLITNSCDSGAIYSKDNLEIKGNGILNIVSDAGNGIKASDNLTIESGNINIYTKGDGIHVNDTFKMKNGSIAIEATGDGIESESIVNISGGRLDIKTTLEPINTDELNKAARQDFSNVFNEVSAEFESSAKGIKADWMMVVSGGEITVNSTDHAVHCASDIEITGGQFTLNSKYGKGISGHGNVTVDGNETVIDVQNATEGLESKDVITINNGTIRIIASDDGINGGGAQGVDMEIPNGDNRLNNDRNRPDRMQEERNDELPEGGPKRPDDDNITPPSDFTSPENRDFENRQPPENMDFMQNNNKNLKNVLIINGGDIEVKAGDDCLDANGNMALNGGTIKASEPNGTVTGVTAVFDPDGTVSINQDVALIAAAGSGAAPSLDISQHTVTLYYDDIHNAGDAIILKDGAGKTVAEYSPAGSYRVVWIAMPDLTAGESYTVTAGEETYAFTLEKNTVIGTAQNSFGGFERNRPQ